MSASRLRIAVPDLVSNSYFPCLAASALGFYSEQGLDVEALHISPVEKCVAALRDGEVDFIGASAHAPLVAFPDWEGVKLICAQSQGLYWLLVMRADLRVARGDLRGLAGRKIAAVPFVAGGLRRILLAAGIDPQAEDIAIISPATAARPGVNFGVAAAQALESGAIDGFMANAMGAEIAVRRGVGTVLLDVRRGDGPGECFGYTMPAIAATDRMIATSPDAAAAIIRAIRRTHAALKADPSQAGAAGERLFPPFEASLIADIIERDLPYYSTKITHGFVATMNAYAHAVGLLSVPALPYDRVVATRFAELWDE
jgi:ABC-type nitrate/sulfonate/bicarbonate transport system substrate-binding protein